ncbi:MAG: GNAT family N-acetyltransferase [Rhodospirillales bacterium]
METAVIDTEVGLTALAGEWDDLLADSAADGLFLTPDWMLAWWRHFGVGGRLFVVVCRSEGWLMGLAPLYLRDARLFGLLPVREARFLGDGIASSDHLDFVLRRGSETAATEALLARLKAEGGFWDRLRLDGLSSDSSLVAFLDVPTTSTNTCPYWDMPASWDAYMASLPSKRRRRFGWRLRKLEKEHDGAVALRTVTREEELAPALESLIRLHQAQQVGRGNAGSFAGDAMRAFHHDVAALLLHRGCLRLHLLTVAGQDIAAIYGFRHGPVLNFYSTGFDPAWDRHNPGRLIMTHSFQCAMEEGLQRYDFLRGDEAYKQNLAPANRYDLNLRYAIKPWFRLLCALERLAKTVKRRLRGMASPPSLAGAEAVTDAPGDPSESGHRV